MRLCLLSVLFLWLLPSVAQAHDCFYYPPEDCSKITVQEDSEQWFFDNILHDDDTLRFKSVTHLHNYNYWQKQEYIMQRIIHDRLKCVRKRQKKIYTTLHDQISNLYMDGMIPRKFQLSDNQRFIYIRANMDSPFNKGFLLVDLLKQEFIFGVEWNHDFFNSEDKGKSVDNIGTLKLHESVWTYDRGRQSYLYYNTEPDGDFYGRNYLMVIIPPNYNAHDMKNIQPYIKKFQDFENEIDTMGHPYAPVIILDHDINYYAIDCRIHD